MAHQSPPSSSLPPPPSSPPSQSAQLYETKYQTKVQTLPIEPQWTEEEENARPQIREELVEKRREEYDRQLEIWETELLECQEEDEFEEITDGGSMPTTQLANDIKIIIKDKIAKHVAERDNEELIEREVEMEMRRRKLGKLCNSFVMEQTPQGNVLMRYNVDKGHFEYYSDASIPYRYLEVVARKYVCSFQCRFVLVDLEQSVKEAEEKAARESDKQEKHAKRSVFAQLRGGGVGRFGRVPTSQKKPGQVQVKPLAVCMGNSSMELSGTNTIKSRINQYSYKGKMLNFSFLQSVPKKMTNPKLSITYAYYKRMRYGIAGSPIQPMNVLANEGIKRPLVMPTWDEKDEDEDEEEDDEEENGEAAG